MRVVCEVVRGKLIWEYSGLSVGVVIEKGSSGYGRRSGDV